MTRKELEKGLYGKDGLCQRIYDKIKEITPRKASEKIGVSTQMIWNFNTLYRKDPKKITIVVIFKYAEKLGVD